MTVVSVFSLSLMSSSHCARLAELGCSLKGLPAGNDRSGIERMGVREQDYSCFYAFIFYFYFIHSSLYVVSFCFFGDVN